MIARVLLAGAAVLAAGGAVAAPLHDPFSESFLVGAYADPARIALEDGLP
ncbi:MAG: hypothetical protein IH621_17785, partial [Krumholzibacteria bacterium]|nr:hypothetical protein [Candidatus Krumholzibacteria bacterium]